MRETAREKKPKGKGTLAWVLTDKIKEILDVGLTKEELTNAYILERGDGYKVVRVRITEVSDGKSKG